MLPTKVMLKSFPIRRAKSHVKTKARLEGCHHKPMNTKTQWSPLEGSKR